MAGIDIQHVRVHEDAGKPLGQFRGIAPVRGRTVPVEQPGGGEDENTGADRQQPRPSGMGLAQSSDQFCWHRGAAVAPTGDDDGAGIGEQFHAAIGQYLDAAHGPHRTLIDRDDTMLVPRKIEFRSWQAEDLHGNAELERAQAVVGQNRDHSWGGLHLAESSRLVSCAPL
ncbi:hypothetical protein D3C75_718190 [compost metagenome]